MRLDVHGYVIVESSNAKTYGLDNLAADNRAAIQAAIDAPYRNVVVGTIGETYTVAQKLLGKANKTLVNFGEIKIRDGVVVNLTHDMPANSNTLQLTGAEDYFKANDDVSLTDNNRIVQGGGSGQTRREARSSTILSVVGDIITFTETCAVGFTVAANARIGHTQSVFVNDNFDKFKITGPGTINGNKQNQLDVEPVFFQGGENDKQGCGVVIYNADDCVLEEVTIKDNLLHDVALNYTYRTKFKNNLTLSGAHDKNALVRHSYDFHFKNTRFKDADYEDSVAMYDTAVRGLIEECSFENFGRYGVVDNDHNADIIIRNCTADGEGCAYSLMHKTTTFEGVNTFKSKGIFRHGASNRPAFRVYLVKTHVQDLNGVTIIGGGSNYCGLNIASCENVEIKNAIVKDMTAPACLATSLVPTTATFRNITFENCVEPLYSNDANTTLIVL